MEDIKMNKWEWLEFMQDSGYAIVRIDMPTIMQVSKKTEYITTATTLSTLCYLVGFLCALGVTAFLILYFNGAF